MQWENFPDKPFEAELKVIRNRKDARVENKTEPRVGLGSKRYSLSRCCSNHLCGFRVSSLKVAKRFVSSVPPLEIIFKLYTCVEVCAWESGARGGQKRVPDPWELEL